MSESSTPILPPPPSEKPEAAAPVENLSEILLGFKKEMGSWCLKLSDEMRRSQARMEGEVIAARGEITTIRGEILTVRGEQKVMGAILEEKLNVLENDLGKYNEQRSAEIAALNQIVSGLRGLATSTFDMVSSHNRQTAAAKPAEDSEDWEAIRQQTRQ
jgi:hypothetical protein